MESAAEVVAGRPAAWPLPSGVASRPEPPGEPRGGAGAELRQCQVGAPDQLCGGGWAPSGPASAPGSAAPPRALGLALPWEAL